MKVKTSELIGAALDWAVATCEGYSASISKSGEVIIIREGVVDYFDPHRNWGWGGPIIQRERIAIDYDHDVWNAAKYGLSWYTGGPTPLIAAMRCFCCSKFGPEVEVPEELP